MSPRGNGCRSIYVRVAAKKMQLTEDNPKNLSFQSEIIAVIYCILKGYADLKSVTNNYQGRKCPGCKKKPFFVCSGYQKPRPGLLWQIQINKEVANLPFYLKGEIKPRGHVKI